jgi:predicted CoA-binding protein
MQRPAHFGLEVRPNPREILERARTIAVVGASRDPYKAGGSVPVGLQARGFRIIPVNPYADELFGERVYRSLLDIPEPVDLVDVFRPAADAPEIARQAALIGARALWLQLDIRSDEARRIAEAAGMDYVEDQCTAVVSSLYQIRKTAAA